jgi:predicted nuclease of predicted toxin-antitoxin system
VATPVKFDESLSESLAEIVRSHGYFVGTVRGQNWGGLKDPVLWPLIHAAGEFLITADKGFGDIRVYPPGTHPGILVLRPERESLSEFRLLLQEVLANHRLESLAGCVTVATSRGIRVRRGP